ncbi:MAG TPA: gas vesicle protein [Nocardioidaceae bacterium]|nr:gas vesicle protein [Nocardioidaceae bacterium]
MTSTSVASRARTNLPQDVALVDLLDRLLGTGVVLAGDVVVSLAGVDLVRIRLQALLMTVRGSEEEL